MKNHIKDKIEKIKSLSSQIITKNNIINQLKKQVKISSLEHILPHETSDLEQSQIETELRYLSENRKRTRRESENSEDDTKNKNVKRIKTVQENITSNKSQKLATIKESSSTLGISTSKKTIRNK